MEDIYALEAQVREYIRQDFSEFDSQKKDFITYLCKAIMSYDSKNFAANYALGVLEILKDDEQEAIMHFQRCISHPKEPLVPAVHLHLASIYYQREDFESANNNFSTALLYRKFELDELVTELSEKIHSQWVPDVLRKGKFIIPDDVRQDFNTHIRKKFDKATEEFYVIKDLELKIHELEKKKDYENACSEFHDYWMKYGKD